MRTNAPRRWALLGVLGLALTACGTTTGDVNAGQRLYNGEIVVGDGNVPTCISCHPVQAGEQGSIGNNLSNIGNRATTTVPGQSAEDYLRESIINPDAYLAGGYQEGIHYRNYKDVLTNQQISDLVAYMLTLKSGQDE